MRLWKKVLATATAGVLCLGSVSIPSLQNVLESAGTVLSASAEGGTYGNLSYNATNTGEIEITGCDMGVTSVEIPAEIDGKRVTSIGDDAFRDCTSLTELTIPESVTSIERLSFYGCTTLTSITIPDSVTRIGYSAFCGCTSLTEITIPDSVTSIGWGTFYNCTSLTSITIPDSVTEIEEDTFFDCINLKNVYISDLGSWCKINFGGFMSNPLCCGANLYVNRELATEITIPDSVTSIGK